ncbi:reverse transcriptase-like protein [Elysia marginata]|uniref:Reverse transcriptase-like protein n=1 Tax=Elysia marginata TaxID=1093978 RepID=A0AAV4EX60_9GAST|nr:reverse transcriptase-like protein [Elysia marginata]
MTKFFKTLKGVRQGCRVRPLLFVLVVEILAIKLRSNENIRGIFDDGALEDKLKFLQYADDMILIVKNQEDLRIALVEIEFFTSISGLQLNRKKSTGMWIGKSKDNEARGEAQGKKVVVVIVVEKIIVVVVVVVVAAAVECSISSSNGSSISNSIIR